MARKTYKKYKKPEIQAKRFEESHPASDRQLEKGKAIVESLNTGQNLSTNAVAGSGKTYSSLWDIFCYVPANNFKAKMGSMKILFTSFANAIVSEVAPYFEGHRNLTAVGFHKLGNAACREAFSNYRGKPESRKTEYILKEMYPAVFDPYATADKAERAKRFSARSLMIKLAHFIKVTLTDYENPNAVMDLVYHFGLDLGEHEDVIMGLVADVMKESDGKTSMLDFDDMLRFPCIYSLPMPQFDLIVGDEQQDFNRVMHVLISKMIKGGGIYSGVGDEFQAIYGFAGADCDSVRNLVKELDCKELILDVNYRCGKEIIAHAQKINPMIQPWEHSPQGSVNELEYEDALKMLRPGDMVESRRNAILVGPVFKLIRNGIPATIKGKDVSETIIALHKKVCGKAKDIADADNMLGDYYDREVARLEKRKDCPKSMFETLEQKVDTLKEFYNACSEDGEGPDAVEGKVRSVFSDKIKDGAVNFTTAHSAKGLEEDRVFILDYDNIEINHPDMKDWERKQERHCHYVAVTRAKTELNLVRSPKEK